MVSTISQKTMLRNEGVVDCPPPLNSAVCTSSQRKIAAAFPLALHVCYPAAQPVQALR